MRAAVLWSLIEQKTTRSKKNKKPLDTDTMGEWITPANFYGLDGAMKTLLNIVSGDVPLHVQKKGPKRPLHEASPEFDEAKSVVVKMVRDEYDKLYRRLHGNSRSWEQQQRLSHTKPVNIWADSHLVDARERCRIIETVLTAVFNASHTDHAIENWKGTVKTKLNDDEARESGSDIDMSMPPATTGSE